MKRVKSLKDTICLIVSFCLAVSLISFPVSAEESVTELMTDIEASDEKDALEISAEEQTVETEALSIAVDYPAAQRQMEQMSKSMNIMVLTPRSFW